MVEAGSDPLACEVEPDRELSAGEGEQTGGVDGAFDLDRPTRTRTLVAAKGAVEHRLVAGSLLRIG
jgi:hypothetical protein